MSMYYLNPVTGKYELQGAPHVDAYSKEQTEQLIAENAGVQVELLWENASPSSNFNNQTIALDLSESDGIFVNYLEGTGDPTYINNEIFVAIGKKGRVCDIVYRNTNSTRIAEATKTGVIFTGDATSQMIPYRIYSVKGVKKV